MPAGKCTADDVQGDQSGTNTRTLALRHVHQVQRPSITKHCRGTQHLYMGTYIQIFQLSDALVLKMKHIIQFWNAGVPAEQSTLMIGQSPIAVSRARS